ncbi:MAG: hypothetical protein AAFZ15_04320 [Bacteroidota bacterium]
MPNNTKYWIKKGQDNELDFLVAVEPGRTVIYGFYRMWDGPVVFSRSSFEGKPRWNVKGFVKATREEAEAVEKAPDCKFCFG